jgi:hypothetical protein
MRFYRHRPFAIKIFVSRAKAQGYLNLQIAETPKYVSDAGAGHGRMLFCNRSRSKTRRALGLHLAAGRQIHASS